MPIPAAGTLPWRVTDDGIQVALVHRPRYNDWSWAKGKLDPGEEWAVAAARETWEETGLEVALGVPLPEARYMVLDRSGAPDAKVVKYWAARVVGGSGKLVNEIDDVAWLDPRAAHERLDYARDRDQLLHLVRLHQQGLLDTWPLIIVRHARAVGRKDWNDAPDIERPLDDAGMTRSARLVDILHAYRPGRVVSSTAVRCLQTVEPFAAAHSVKLRTRPGLSEEGYADDPSLALTHLDRLIARGRPAVLCSHGPLLPDIVGVLQALISDVSDASAAALLDAARSDRLAKGEALVAHLSGHGAQARVVSVERHLP